MRYLLPALLLCCAAAASGAELVEFKPPGLAVDTGVGCDLRNQLPDEFLLFATSAYAGRESTQQIDQSGSPAGEFDVAVHSPEIPVVVALAASAPTIWRVGWSAKTRIVAVVASGSHRQIVLGLPRGIPVLVITGNSGCPDFSYFLESGRIRDHELSRANAALRKIVGKDIDRVYSAKERGTAVLGSPGAGERYQTSNDFQLSDFVKADMPLAGRAGVQAAMKAGTLRVATDADMQKALASAGGNAKQRLQWLRDEGRRGHVWVVQSAFTIPAGLYGAHSEIFLLPEDVPEPMGNPGHSTVFRLGKGACTGPACPP